MKTQHWLIALLVFFLCSTVVYAGQSVHNTNHKLDGLTQDDGITALEAGDALGFEVLSRAELESVRGEAWYINVLTGAIIGTMTLKLMYGDALCNSGGCFFLPWFLKPLKAY